MGLLSQFIHESRQIHWQRALLVLAYIKNSPGKDLIYNKHGHLQIKAYSDSGYIGDRGDRKSTSGYYTYVGGNLVTWRSKKQTVVSRSNAEVEYKAMPRHVVN